MNIAEASNHIAELLGMLNNAYWEASSLENKDANYNLVRILTNEYIELMKISVQDHHYPYEVISTTQESLQNYLQDYQQHRLKSVIRFETQRHLGESLNQLLAYFSKSAK